VRVDDIIHVPPHKRSEPIQGSRSDPSIRNDSPTAHATIEDVVQLTLGRDGVWEVNASSAADSSTIYTSPRFSDPALPRAFRLYRSLLRVYSPEGIARAFEPTRGTLIDVYA
jgi:hypothetical protein